METEGEAMTTAARHGSHQARRGLTVLDGFLGITAVFGGLTLLFGWLPIPASLLIGSPFTSYTIPALALTVLVGGGGVLATVLMRRRSSGSLAASGLAGLALLIFEAVELALIGFSWLLALYVALGLAIVALAFGLWLAERAAPHGAAVRAAATPGASERATYTGGKP